MYLIEIKGKTFHASSLEFRESGIIVIHRKDSPSVYIGVEEVSSVINVTVIKEEQ